MALTYKINIFETDPADASKTQVTLVVTDDTNDRVFAITKSVTTGSNTNAQIVKAAQTAAQSEINTWEAQGAVTGKTWNPDTEEIV